MYKQGIATLFLVGILTGLCGLVGCDGHPWNDPYPYEDQEANVLYTAFSERPKHLDPARSYSEPEYEIIGQIYEPPLQYHYLKRPYVLEPLTATFLPEVHYFNAEGKRLPENAAASLVAYSDYIIHIKPGILYQPHPAFAKNEQGKYLYQHLSKEESKRYRVLKDFNKQDTREATAEDYVYQIKRLAEPHLGSPIFGLMSRYISGLKELREVLIKDSEKTPSNLEMDLRNYRLSGVEVIDRYTYRIRVQGKYLQFRFWLAMPFFAPIPWEVAQFYAQPGFEEHNISLDWYPVGTGPFMLAENNPDRRMILVRNPNFRGELYPNEGEPDDEKLGLLEDANKPIPMVDKVIFTLEKEEIPHWNKFLQGYYDVTGISSDNFGSSVHFTPQGGAEVTEKIKQQGIRLQTSVAPGIWYWGFNLLDETVGGYSEKTRKLRQAITMVFNVDEFISIFLNGRGVLATGPIPPNIFGFETQPTCPGSPITEPCPGTSVAAAQKLFTEAGFKEGHSIHFDTVVTGDPDEIAIQAWLKKQFEKIGIQVVVRGTDYNRFQEKLRLGNVQMFFFGWNGDYPDPENFLSLFYGPNGSARFGGENNVNYSNKEYDALFEKMRSLSDGPERLGIIREMVKILRNDIPWIWGFYPKSFALYHEWVRIGKPSAVATNTLKYARVNPALRAKQRLLWNKPILWPFWIILGLILIVILPASYKIWRKGHTPMERL